MSVIPRFVAAGIALGLAATAASLSSCAPRRSDAAALQVNPATRPAAAAAPAPIPFEQAPAAIHLVGHEDAALLARVQGALNERDPRRMQNPYLKSVPALVGGKTVVRPVLRRTDLAEFIADPEAAIALGKALYWEMQAGSDFRRRIVDGKSLIYGTACASCHYRNGIDARTRNTTRVPYVAWKEYNLDNDYPAKAKGNAGPPNYAEGEFEQLDHTPNADPAKDYERLGVALIVGSQGVEPRLFKGLGGALPPNGNWDSEKSTVRRLWSEVRAVDKGKTPREQKYKYDYEFKPEWSMFLETPGVDKRPPVGEPPSEDKRRALRQITNRNSPSTANAVFADRLFHDGRAESTFNGFSIFGDQDQREVIHKRLGDSNRAIPVKVALPNAALASQAVGPVVNDVEMSYFGRTFPDLAEKLLSQKWLAHQAVDPNDSVLSAPWLYADVRNTDRVTYAALIQKAFRKEWWDTLESPLKVKLELRDAAHEPTARQEGSLMQANFPLYWGLSILLYESTLISDESPFDFMLRGNGEFANERWEKDYKAKLGPVLTTEIAPILQDGTSKKLELTTGTAVFQLGFRTFMNRGCIECHSVPLFSELYELPEAEAELVDPIDFQITRTLIPNAQGDAIAAKMTAFRKATEAAVVVHLATLAIPAEQHAGWMPRLWRLLDEARGDDRRLIALVETALARPPGPQPANPPFKKIANLLMLYEKKVSGKLGERTFFSEDERVALAEILTPPVLVEKMLIPPDQRMEPEPLPRPLVRDAIPISGLPAREPYAFYDVGFYQLGVSPPRFDRGIGFWTGERTDVQEEEVEKDGGGDRAAAPPNAPDALVAPNATAPTKRSRSSSAGPRGQAYEFRTQWKAAPAAQQRQREKGQAKQKAVEKQEPDTSYDPDIDRDVLTEQRDYSWSRNELPPGSGLAEMEFDRRRSDLHFLARSRRLVFDEEPTGHRKPFLHDNELAFWGAFKTPTLRNVELTAPYMHNGRLYELSDVINFYDRAGALWQRQDTNPDKHPDMTPLRMTQSEKKALEFFLACLTDPRVRKESAPFDHPALIVVDGYERLPNGGIGAERPIVVKEVGRYGLAGGLPPLPQFPSAADPVINPATNPANRPASGPTTAPATGPATSPVTGPATQP